MLLSFGSEIYSKTEKPDEEEIIASGSEEGSTNSDNGNTATQQSGREERTSGAVSNITIIPLVGGSSEKGFSFGAAIYALGLLSSRDIFMVSGAVSTTGDSYFHVSTWNNKFFNRLFSYKLGAGYRYSGITRYYGTNPYNITEESNLTFKKLDSDLLFGINLTPRINTGFGLIIEKINTSGGRTLDGVNETFASFPDESENYRSSFSLARRVYIKYDSRNSAEFPTRGTKLELDLDRSDGTLGSELIFTRITSECVFFLPLYRGLTLGNRAVLTNIIGNDLPYYSLAGIGGAYLLRSFGPYRFMARHSAVLGSELRFQFLKPKKKRWYNYFEAALFADTGNVSDEIKTFTIKNQQYSIGAGLRVSISPGAILRFDYATNGTEHYFYLQQGYPF
ncbi:MAG: BamA/TamA family outer membrane protein [Oligoflexia bacterium]|nr:BamA/TamA family outer membrane protein [Oligoflexia bacterium]